MGVPAGVGGAVFLLGGIDYLTAWRIFGASNQLLAALTLLALAIWMRRRGKSLVFVLVPMVFLMVMTLWALGLGAMNPANPMLIRVLSAVLIGLAGSVILLCVRPLARPEPMRSYS